MDGPDSRRGDSWARLEGQRACAAWQKGKGQRRRHGARRHLSRPVTKETLWPPQPWSCAAAPPCKCCRTIHQRAAEPAPTALKLYRHPRYHCRGAGSVPSCAPATELCWLTHTKGGRICPPSTRWRLQAGRDAIGSKCGCRTHPQHRGGVETDCCSKQPEKLRCRPGFLLNITCGIDIAAFSNPTPQ